MFEWTGDGLVVNFGALTWASAGWFALFANMLYGLVTQVHSAKQIREWNIERRNNPDLSGHHHYSRSHKLSSPVSQARAFWLLPYRLLFNGPVRILSGMVGLPVAAISPLTAGRFESNACLDHAWKWHQTPIEIQGGRA